MTFESIIENLSVNDNVIANTNGEALALKVSYGTEMRRAAFNGASFEVLNELVATLFGLERTSVVVKYQDEDGDKITMSSNAELKEALQLSKEKKILRLFVDAKTPAVPVAPVVQETEVGEPELVHPFGHPLGFGKRRGFPHHGPFGGPHHGPFGPRGGFHHGPYHHGPHGHGAHGPHGHGPHGHGPHGHGPFGGHGFRFSPFGTFSPANSNNNANSNSTNPASPGGPTANFNAPHMFAHGSFSSAHDQTQHHDANPHAARCAFKEHKHGMKQHLKFMKENASTPDDFLAIKAMKQQMRAECKAMWEGFHAERKQLKHMKKMKHEGDRYFSKHVADVTVPDNSELAADTPVTKTWRLKNAGTTAWPADSQLIFISRHGDNLNGPERVPVGAVEPQNEVDVSLTFITPSEPGRYIGYYRMATADGAKFGQRVWVSFVVPALPVLETPLVPVPVATAPTAPTAPENDVTMD